MPFIEGSEESIPSLRRSIMCGAEAVVQKNAPLLALS